MIKTIDYLHRYIFNFTVFKALTIVLLFATQIPFVHIAIGGYIKYLLFFGMLICAFDVLKMDGANKFKDKTNILLLVFVSAYMVSIVLNREYCFSENCKQLVYMLVFFYAFFMIDADKDIGSVQKEMKIISLVIIVLTFFLSFASFLTYVLNIREWYIDRMHEIGVYAGRLSGFYNSNSCGSIAAVSLITSLFFLFLQKRDEKIRYWIIFIAITVNVSMQYIVLLLSQSRGSYFSFILTMAIIVFISSVKNINKSIFARTMIAFLLSFIVIFGIVKLSNVIQNNAPYLMVVSDEDSIDAEKDTTYENAIESILRKYYEETSAKYGMIGMSISDSILNGIGRDRTGLISTNGRIDLWKLGVSLFIKQPVFGTTREGLVVKGNEILINESSALIGGGLHNLLLTILVSSGLVGFIVIVAFCVKVLMRVAKLISKPQKIDSYIIFSFAIVTWFFISELVENRILYQVTVYNAIFWIYLGYLNFFAFKRLKNDSCIECSNSDI